MTTALFIVFGIICALGGFMWGQRHPRIVNIVRPPAEDTARIDYLNNQQGHLAFEGGYWSCLTGRPRTVTGINWDIRVAIDNSMAKQKEWEASVKKFTESGNG